MVETVTRQTTGFADFADRAATHHYRLESPPWTDIPAGRLAEHLRVLPFMRPVLACLELRLPLPSVLVEDPLVFTESTKEKWQETRSRSDIDKAELASIERLDAAATEAQIGDIARGGAIVLHLADWLHAKTGKPVALLFNGRGGTPFSYALDRVPHVEIGRESSSDIAAIEAGLDALQDGSNPTPLVVVRDMKISSHEYVHSVQEARHLSGNAPWRTKLRTRFSASVDGVVEYVPDAVASIMEHGWPVIYVDVPTWGPAYSCSTGLDRKPKDRSKWDLGVRRPYKMKSYADYAGYTSYALSALKARSADNIDFVIPEEMIGEPTGTTPICFFVSPYAGIATPVWDNRPQFLGDIGHAYSPLAEPDGYRMMDPDGSVHIVPRLASVRTDRGVVPLDVHVRDQVSSLALLYHAQSL